VIISSVQKARGNLSSRKAFFGNAKMATRALGKTRKPKTTENGRRKIE